MEDTYWAVMKHFGVMWVNVEFTMKKKWKICFLLFVCMCVCQCFRLMVQWEASAAVRLWINSFWKTRRHQYLYWTFFHHVAVQLFLQCCTRSLVKSSWGTWLRLHMDEKWTSSEKSSFGNQGLVQSENALHSFSRNLVQRACRCVS